MWILGINTGLNSSAVLLKDEEIVFGVQEERLSRVKNQPGFPTLSIRAALDEVGLCSNDIDKVCVGGTSSRIIETREDDLRKYHERYEQIKKSWFQSKAFPTMPFLGHKFDGLGTRKSQTNPKLLEQYLDEFGFTDKQVRYDHHLCHAASAYFGLAKDFESECLVFTMDGGGDRTTSAVFKGSKGQLSEIASSVSMSLAGLYAHITYILGFLPHEHEYKLMGLAPYADHKYSAQVRDRFHRFIGFSETNPLVFTNNKEYPNLDKTRGPDKIKWIDDLYRTVMGVRFDSLASGLQLFVEQMTRKWILAAMETTGIRKILLSGGFFMNVKVNQLISHLPEVDSVDCFPSCGDETNAFGAAFLGYHESLVGTSYKAVKFSNFCIGTSARNDLESAKQRFSTKVEFKQIENPNSAVASLLNRGKIVARCSGKMEFGARALGNRSILAAPNSLEMVYKINRAVKKRDFWMPFAPAILLEHAAEMLDIPAALTTPYSSYMMFTFNVKQDKFSQIVAGTQQADRTARAQLVDKQLYPDLHEIISNYYHQTGIPAVLNTSFNLHGYPIVTGVEEAVEVLLDSEIDYLLVEDWLVRTKSTADTDAN